MSLPCSCGKGNWGRRTQNTSAKVLYWKWLERQKEYPDFPRWTSEFYLLWVWCSGNEGQISFDINLCMWPGITGDGALEAPANRDPHFCAGQIPFVLPLEQQLVIEGLSAALCAFPVPAAAFPQWKGHPKTHQVLIQALFQGDKLPVPPARGEAAEPVLPWLSGKRNWHCEGVLSFSGGESFRNAAYCAGNKRDCFHSYLVPSGNCSWELLEITGFVLPWILYINGAFETEHENVDAFVYKSQVFWEAGVWDWKQSEGCTGQGSFAWKFKLFLGSSALFYRNSFAQKDFPLYCGQWGLRITCIDSDRKMSYSCGKTSNMGQSPSHYDNLNMKCVVQCFNRSVSVGT